MNAMRFPSRETDGEPRTASLHGGDAVKIIGDAAPVGAVLGHQAIAAVAMASNPAAIQAAISRPWIGRRTAAPVVANAAPELAESLIAWSANAKSRADWKRSPGSF